MATKKTAIEFKLPKPKFKKGSKVSTEYDNEKGSVVEVKAAVSYTYLIDNADGTRRWICEENLRHRRKRK